VAQGLREIKKNNKPAAPGAVKQEVSRDDGSKK
jgi:hypothetical protein